MIAEKRKPHAQGDPSKRQDKDGQKKEVSQARRGILAIVDSDALPRDRVVFLRLWRTRGRLFGRGGEGFTKVFGGRRTRRKNRRRDDHLIDGRAEIFGFAVLGLRGRFKERRRFHHLRQDRREVGIGSKQRGRGRRFRRRSRRWMQQMG